MSSSTRRAVALVAVLGVLSVVCLGVYAARLSSGPLTMDPTPEPIPTNPGTELFTTLDPNPEAREPEPFVPPPPEDAPLGDLADWVRPRGSEASWANVPWITNLDQAQVLAAQTRRLMFIWGTYGPQGRC